jgi:hypothetical protein
MEVTLPSRGLTPLPTALVQAALIVAVAAALPAAVLVFALAKPTHGRG